eukprot:TRINITY_DN45879_c0_g1_i1.p1 TRINITY_DN45879_c0_g1~~TRINITY_DN45879_c0_g1_i1.p1  ORF type:complete len:573 (-),score=283.53 TRINITY_DN45879_c0_g1_i1:49-1737(-)
MNAFSSALLVLLSLALGGPTDAYMYSSIWPHPVSMTVSATTNTTVSSSMTMSCSQSPCPATVQAAFQRYEPLIFINGASAPSSAPQITSLVVTVVQRDVPLSVGVDESYTLTVTQTEATVKANTQWGALRGIESFSQLVHWSAEAGGEALRGKEAVKRRQQWRRMSGLERLAASDNVYTVYNVPITVQDKPRFAWRGVLIDTSRHYLTVPTIMRTLEVMSWSKYNVLHWHLTDDNSFPLQSEKYPKFTEKGAYSPYEVYTIDDVTKIVSYAESLGITVVPELDMPAHAAVWGKAYPQTVCQCADGQTLLDPTGPAYPIIQGLVEEFKDAFSSPFIHFGGDEVHSFKCWDESENVTAFKKAHGFTTDAEVRNYFQTQVQKIAANVSKSPVFWEEVFDQGFTLQPDAIVNVWLSTDEVIKAIKAKHRVVSSYGWYLDQQNPPGGSHYLWEDTWQNFYLHDPIGNATLTPDELALALGGEASMWGEQVSSVNIWSRMWPRGLAAAERLWSPQNIRDINMASQRLAQQRCNLAQRGVGAGPIRPGNDYVNCLLPTNHASNQPVGGV